VKRKRVEEIGRGEDGREGTGRGEERGKG